MTAFGVSGSQVVQNHGAILQLTFGQFLFDARLPREQPVHCGIEFGFVGGVQCQRLSETAVKRIGMQSARSSEFGSGIDDTGDDHGDGRDRVSGWVWSRGWNRAAVYEENRARLRRDREDGSVQCGKRRVRAHWQWGDGRRVRGGGLRSGRGGDE